MRKKATEILKKAIYCKIEEEEAIEQVLALLGQPLQRAIGHVKQRQDVIRRCREDARAEFYQALVDHDEKRILKWGQVLHETTVWAIQNQIVVDILEPKEGPGSAMVHHPDRGKET